MKKMLKEFNLAIILTLVYYLSPNGVHAQSFPPVVSWYWQGQARINYSLTVNTGSSLVLGCLAKASNNIAGSTVSPAFALTKASAPTVAVSVATAGAKPFGFTASGGTLLWDSVNGNAAGYDYILAIVSIPPTPSYVANRYPASGYLQMYIPTLVTTDAGLYYCTFFDGSSTTVDVTNYGNSGWFSLAMTKKSGSGSFKSAQRNKALEYSLALIGASKLLL